MRSRCIGADHVFQAAALGAEMIFGASAVSAAPALPVDQRQRAEVSSHSEVLRAHSGKMRGSH